MADQTHYEILGVACDASLDDVRTAHRRLVKQLHPDIGGNAAMFREVRTAYETLNNPDERAAYDAGQRLPTTTPQAGEPPPGSRKPTHSPNPKSPRQPPTASSPSFKAACRIFGVAVIVAILLITASKLAHGMNSASGAPNGVATYSAVVPDVAPTDSISPNGATRATSGHQASRREVQLPLRQD